MGGSARGLGYRVIAVVLRQWINCGRYRSGDQFPTEAALVQAFGVSRVTMRRALAELTRDGMIESRQGTGTFVSSSYVPPKFASKLTERSGQHIYAGLTEWVDADTYRYVGKSDVRRSEEERLVFGPKAGPVFASLRYLRIIAHEPVAYLVIDMVDWAAAMIPEHSEAILLHINAYLRNRGLATHRVRMSIDATSADRILARQLQIAVQDPVVRIAYLCFDKRDRAFQKLNWFYRADRFNYDLEFTLYQLGPHDDSRSDDFARLPVARRRSAKRSIRTKARGGSIDRQENPRGKRVVR